MPYAATFYTCLGASATYQQQVGTTCQQKFKCYGPFRLDTEVFIFHSGKSRLCREIGIFLSLL